MTDPAHYPYPHLFEPAAIGGVQTVNRCVVSPMTRTSATHDGHATLQMAEYYADFARGGWGLVFTEATYIDKKSSQGYDNQPGIAGKRQMQSWCKVVDAVHDAGAPIFMQLYHAGALNQGNAWTKETIGPSAVRPKGQQASRYGGTGPYPEPREITRDEIAEVIGSFAAAARRAVEAGFDGIEVHGANGYLPDQFLTTYTNLRTDDYGGSLENRLRFHLQVLRAVRDAVPGDVPVGVRMSQTKSNDKEYAWPGGAEDARYIFAALAETGIDFIDIASHLGCGPVFGTPHGLAGLAREYGGLPVIAVGGLEAPAAAEDILARGEADYIGLARGALADPDWPAKVGRGEMPVAFDPAMLTPLATLDNAYAWRQRRAG